MSRRTNNRRDWSPYHQAMGSLLEVRGGTAYAQGDLMAIEAAASLALASEMAINAQGGRLAVPRSQRAELQTVSLERHARLDELGAYAGKGLVYDGEHLA